MLLGQVLDKVDVFKGFGKDRPLEFVNIEDAYVMSRYFPRGFSRSEAEKLMKFL